MSAKGTATKSVSTHFASCFRSVLDIGSFRGAGGFIADELNRQIGQTRYGYMDFYMGTAWITCRADVTVVYEMIFKRLATLVCGSFNPAGKPNLRKGECDMPSERFIASKWVPEQLDLTAQVERLRKVLAKRKKVELIEALVDLAIDERKVLRQLESRFDVRAPVDDLVTSTRQAIADATAFDERRINYNFDYDDQAYETVQRNLRRLVELGAFKEAMELSLELMSRGSYQVEMSDEGLMTEDIEACLRPVIDGLRQSEFPPDSIVQWCDAMSRADRGGFICERELRSMREKFGLDLVCERNGERHCIEARSVELLEPLPQGHLFLAAYSRSSAKTTRVAKFGGAEAGGAQEVLSRVRAKNGHVSNASAVRVSGELSADIRNPRAAVGSCFNWGIDRIPGLHDALR